MLYKITPVFPGSIGDTNISCLREETLELRNFFVKPAHESLPAIFWRVGGIDEFFHLLFHFYRNNSATDLIATEALLMKIQVIMVMHKSQPHLMYLHETSEGNWYCLEYDRNIYFTQSILNKDISTQHPAPSTSSTKKPSKHDHPSPKADTWPTPSSDLTA